MNPPRERGRTPLFRFVQQGPVTGSEPIFNSYVQITKGGSLVTLGSAAATGPELVLETGISVRSNFSINQLVFRLTQSSTYAVNGGAVVGSVLTQSYAITNTPDVMNTFSIVRCLDGDLYVNDGSLSDGGGMLSAGGGQIVLFETDATGNGSDVDTFVDTSFDATLAMSRDFAISPGQTQTFTTRTLLGNSEPVPPGDTETRPQLPRESNIVDGTPVYFF